MDAAFDPQRDEETIKNYLLHGPTLRDDLSFIKEYRKRLRRILSSAIMDVTTGGSMENADYLARLVELTHDIETRYMQPLTAENVMQKVAFVNAIGGEFADFAYDSQLWNINRAKEAKPLFTQMLGFMQFALLSGPVESGQLERLFEENAHSVAQQLVDALSKNFMAYVDLENLTYADVYYLIGSISSMRDLYKKEWDEFTMSTCDKCGRDDCTTPVTCASLDEKESKGNRYAKYEELMHVINKKLRGEKIDSYQLTQSIKSLKEGPRRTLLEAFLKDKLMPGTKKISVAPSPDFAAADEMMVKTELYKMLSLGHGVDYDCPKDVAIQIIVNDLDFSNARGGAMKESLASAYESAQSKVKAINAQSQEYNCLSKLLARYQEYSYTSEEKKGEE